MPVLSDRPHLLQSVERQAGLALRLRLPPRQAMAPVGHSFGPRKSAKVKRVFFAFFVLSVAQCCIPAPHLRMTTTGIRAIKTELPHSFYKLAVGDRRQSGHDMTQAG